MRKALAPDVQHFPGVRKPTTDYNALQQGLRGLPFYRDVDLSTARTIAAGTALEIIAAGNTFYCDPLIDAAGVPIGGVAIVHFQDTTLSPGGTPFTIYPQAIMNVPFTRLLIENPAQAGKKMRFIFGVDLDFSPGINANVSIVGTVGVNDRGFTYGASFKSVTALAASGGTETVFTPAANVSGATVWAATAMVFVTALPGATILIAHTAVPGTILTGDALATATMDTQDAGKFSSALRLPNPVRVAAGKGLYWYSGAGENAPVHRMVLYTLD